MAFSFRSRLKNIFGALQWEAKKLNPSFRARWREHVDFDARYGVSTLEPVQLGELGFSPEGDCYWYESTEPWVFADAVKALPPDLSDYHWIDLGCGKGRILLMASMLKLRRVTGVELSPILCQVARDNLSCFSKAVTQSVECVQGDAAEFAFPTEGALVVSLYNSFGPKVLRGALRNLLLQHTGEREVYFLYINPKHRDVLEETRRFESVRITEKFELFRRVN
jgi:SAM-dependent methyltransferase